MFRPHCVATTGRVAFEARTSSDGPIPGIEDVIKVGRIPHANGFPSGVRFTADGTTVIAASADHCLRSFILPTDLLDAAGSLHLLGVKASITHPSPLQSYAVYPGFNLQDPSSTLCLSAALDVPVTLQNVVYRSEAESASRATYPLVDKLTEAYITPSSLIFTSDGYHFLAGSKSQISLFDITRDGQEPVDTYRTGSRKVSGSINTGPSGVISALSISERGGYLAVGTRLREVGIYSSEGKGEYITHFSLARHYGERDHISGSGVMHLAWSPCGTYLYAAERQSDSVQVFDIRNTGLRVSCLTGRKANTTQKLSIDVVPTAEGCELWAGGTDGHVRMWTNPGAKEWEHAPDADLEMHQDAVAGVSWHPSGMVLATCSGSRGGQDGSSRTRARSSEAESDVSTDGESSASEYTTGSRGVTAGKERGVGPLDNTLKIWTVDAALEPRKS